MLEELTQVETFRKFNQVYKEYQKVKSDEIVNLINRYLAVCMLQSPAIRPIILIAL